MPPSCVSCPLSATILIRSLTGLTLKRASGRPRSWTLLCWCAVRILVLFTVGQVVHDIRLCYWIYPVTWTISSTVYLFVFRRVGTELLGGANPKAVL